MAVYPELVVSEEVMLRQHRSEILLDTANIRDVLKSVGAEDWDHVKEFTEPWGEDSNTFIHLASYAGKLRILKRAEAAGFNLYTIDNVGRCALHYAAARGHVDIIKWLVERSTDELQRQDLSGRTALHLAVLNTRVKVVKILVDAGVNVNINDKHNMTPFHLAWLNINPHDAKEMSRYEDIVNIILTSPVFERIIDTSEMSMTSFVLNQAVLLNSTTATIQLLDLGLTIPKDAKTLSKLMLPLHIAAARGFHEMLCLLLERKKTSWMIDIREKLGNTPLHVAVIQCQWICARTLINLPAGKDGGMRKDPNQSSRVKAGNLSTENKSGQTVLDDLFRYNEHPLTFLTEILDTKVSEFGKDANDVKLSFDVLVPRVDQRQMAVVSALIASVPNMRKMNILQHPLIEAFLGVKWRRVRIFFFILVAYQALFVVCLITYGTILLQTKRSSPGPAWILFVCACIQLCHNTVQLFMMPKYYAKQLEIWLFMTMAAICVIVVIAERFYPIASMGSALPWTIQSIGIAMLLACIQIMFLIGRFPSWASYALMFITVLKTALKVFLAVVSILVGFSFSFLVIFYGHQDFPDPWKAFVKTIVMMTGEYDYSELFPSTDNKNSSADRSNYDSENSSANSLNYENRENSCLSIIRNIVFLAFIMLASIVVMNLMTGLAVSDTHGLLNEGLVRRLLKQAEFLNHIELITPHGMFQSWLVPRKLKNWLKSKNNIETPIMLGSLRRCIHRPPGISEKLVNILYKLAAKNRNLRQKFQMTCFYDDHGKSLSERILYLEERLEELQRDKMRPEGMRTQISSDSTEGQLESSTCYGHSSHTAP